MNDPNTGRAIVTGARPAREQRAGVDHVLVMCMAVPAVVLTGSYIWLAIDHGTPLLWNVVVHESGRYTFGETVLYFSHFLREVPVVIAYALFLLAISGNAAAPVAESARHHGRTILHIAALGAAALVTVALIATVRADGAGSALRDLLQYRTRDDLVGYGTHWRYHLLSTLWFGAVAMIAPAVLRAVAGTTVLEYNRPMVRAAWLYVTLLTLVFGISADVFVDVRYVGHQAREIITHGPVTLLLGIGLLLAVRQRTPAPQNEASVQYRPVHAGLAILVLLIPAFLAIMSLSGNVMEHGQADAGLGAMVAAHYFEHTLDYTLVLLLVAGGLALHRHSSTRRSHVANGPYA